MATTELNVWIWESICNVPLRMNFEDTSAESIHKFCTTQLLFACLNEFRMLSTRLPDTTFVLKSLFFRTFNATLTNVPIRTKRGHTGVGSSTRMLLTRMWSIVFNSVVVENPVMELFFFGAGGVHSFLFSRPLRFPTLTQGKLHCHTRHCFSWTSYFSVFKPCSLLYGIHTSTFCQVFLRLTMFLPGTSILFIPHCLLPIVWLGFRSSEFNIPAA